MSSIQNPEAINTFISAFSVVSFGFILYHLVTNNPAFKSRESVTADNTLHIIIQRLIGIFLFGFSSLFIITYYLHLPFILFGTGLPDNSTFIWLLILSVFIIPMNYYNSGNPGNLSQYPQIRNHEWSFSLLILSALSWIAYLLAYEFMFRGFFLFSSVPVLGVWPAIILNTAVYSLVHIPKGTKETLGSIPLGIILSYLAVKTGSFWIAFFTHVILAISNEWFSLAAHPEMHFKKALL